MAIIKQYRKATDTTYVLEAIPQYDPVRKKTTYIKRHIIGKIDPITGDVVPTGKPGRPRKQKEPENPAAPAEPKEKTAPPQPGEHAEEEYQDTIDRLQRELAVERRKDAKLSSKLAAIRAAADISEDFPDNKEAEPSDQSSPPPQGSSAGRTFKTILRNPYPVCEYDRDRACIIKPSDFVEPTLPAKCVVTFFRKELQQLAEEKALPVIDYLHSEVLDIPIYEYTTPAERICITMPFSGAPGAAATIEELHAMGCSKFLICGAAGSIAPGSKVGEIIVPTSAVRDEGTSYHYLEPSREVECPSAATAFVTSGLERLGLPYKTGKTWTTDAMYRETPEMIALRRQEGCITVEMEAAAFFAVAQYHDLSLAQLLYAGDDVSGETWDSRNWNSQKSVRSNLLSIAVQLMEDF